MVGGMRRPACVYVVGAVLAVSPVGPSRAAQPVTVAPPCQAPAEARDGKVLLDIITAAMVDESRAEGAQPFGSRQIINHLDAIAARVQQRRHLLPRCERLIAVGPDLQLLGMAEGSARAVVLGPAFDRPLWSPGADIVLVHNHPQSASLSRADLGQLAKPGVYGIVAVGHDGSVYFARAGRAFPGAAFESVTYKMVSAEMNRALRVQGPSSRAMSAVFERHYEHLVALVLHKSGVIEYRARLSAERAASYASCRGVCGPVTEAVAAKLRRTFARDPD